MSHYDGDRANRFFRDGPAVTAGSNDRSVAIATALLRISLGVMFLAHSVILKYVGYTLAGTAGYFASIGLPAVLAYVVFAMEVAGGALLVLGIGTRWVAAALIPVLAGAVWAHTGNGWVFSNEGGGWEYPLYLVVVSAAQVLLGDGAWALSRRVQRKAAPATARRFAGHAPA